MLITDILASRMESINGRTEGTVTTTSDRVRERRKNWVKK